MKLDLFLDLLQNLSELLRFPYYVRCFSPVNGVLALYPKTRLPIFSID